MATGEKSRIFEHQSDLALRITDRKAELESVKQAIDDLKVQTKQSFAEQKAEAIALNKKVKDTQKQFAAGLSALNKKFNEIRNDIKAKEALINQIVMSDADRNDFKTLLKPIKASLTVVSKTINAIPNDRALRAPRVID
jgi:chromosome segregation ATPase